MQAAGVGWGLWEKAVFQNPFFGFWNLLLRFETACSRRRRVADSPEGVEFNEHC